MFLYRGFAKIQDARGGDTYWEAPGFVEDRRVRVENPTNSDTQLWDCPEDIGQFSAVEPDGCIGVLVEDGCVDAPCDTTWVECDDPDRPQFEKFDCVEV